MLTPASILGGEDLISPILNGDIKNGREVIFSEMKQYRIENALLMFNGAVCTMDGSLISDAMPFHRRDSKTHYPFEKLDAENSRRIKGKTLLVHVSAPAMSHFFMEGLPFIVANQFEIDNIIFCGPIHNAFIDLIVNFISRNIQIFTLDSLLVEGVRVIAVENAIVPVYRCCLHPSIIGMKDIIISKAVANKTQSDLTGGYIYISRQDAINCRVLVNELDVIEAMKSVGFEILELNHCSEATVIEKFNNARLIVGPMGAGLYNSLFSKPNSIVLALNSPNYNLSFLDQFSVISGFSRAYFFGPDFLSYEDFQRGGHNNFLVDEVELLNVVTILKDYQV